MVDEKFQTTFWLPTIALTVCVLSVCVSAASLAYTKSSYDWMACAVERGTDQCDVPPMKVAGDRFFTWIANHGG